MATEVVIPMLGVTVERGRIVEWLKKEGDHVEKGESIFIVEVEKATTEVESPATGILAKILVPEGVEVPVLTVVGIITEPGEELPAEYTGVEGPLLEGASRQEAVPEMARPDVAAEEGPPGIIRAVPAARKLAREYNLDLSTIEGTGPEGTVLYKDVTQVLEKVSGESRVSSLARRIAEKEGVSLENVKGTGVRGRIMAEDVAAAAEVMAEGTPSIGQTITMSNMRSVIARRMSESAFTAPHIYFFTEVCLDPLMQFRKEILSDFEKYYQVRLSINDFFIKAVALNILDFPILNAQLKEDKIHIMPEINVGLAVAVEEGLVVPAIANADKIGLAEIARQRGDLVTRARSGGLSIDEMERGTFTISSLAQYDVTHFTAILNPPQSGILTVGKTDEKLVMFDNEIGVKHITRLGLSVDHRIIDGAVAADFLQNLKWKLERPSFTFLAR
ncbi:MAG: 2-oxo acid dehydrogenase subunit E2 [Deltaproteobacteria bacterium]|nr:2-oxo acid dehydrogenase subunit E2 [Deltaproteobacteria bacterium]